MQAQKPSTRRGQPAPVTDPRDKLDSIIFEANDTLLYAQGYANAASLILTSLQTQARGAFVDDALHSLELVVCKVTDSIKEARSLIEDMDILTRQEARETRAGTGR